MDAYLYCMAGRIIMERPEARAGSEDDGRGKRGTASGREAGGWPDKTGKGVLP